MGIVGCIDRWRLRHVDEIIGPRGPSRFSAAVIGGLGGALLTL